MKRLELQKVLTEIKGEWVQGELPTTITQVVDDPSDVGSDKTLLFDCYHQIQTWRFDSYKNCVIVTEDSESWSKMSSDHAVVRVNNVHEAYHNFVRYYRGLFTIPVIAITGTCGKTTTKEMIAHMLSKKYKVQSTVRSKNDPLFNLGYLLGIDNDTNVAVFETAVGKKGDLLRSCRFFRPNIGAITNIGIDHLNKFASHDEYIQAKGEMLPGLQYTGTLVLNTDDENIRKIDLTSFKGSVVTFGFSEQSAFQIMNIKTQENGTSFSLRFEHLTHQLFVPGYGEHNVYNAVAAIAVVYSLGIGIDEAGEQLRFYQPLPGHMNVLPGINGSVVIDDSWSSNPTSMHAALNVLNDLAQGRKKIAVLGKMAALGKFADEHYARLGQRLVDQKIDVLITRNSIAKDFAKYALRFGMKQEQIYTCTEINEIERILRKLMSEDTIVLIKSSMKDYKIENLVKNMTC
ncbi:UDP-N-acetylmuramoyl-tripeptide--D-alanyl-D-alanine ligase [Alicyclobacillus fastidiosus]|uniref:UDP-N-acetylmuramoyl-tripeptide--D-alanyl-D-alanine ligase n=1 Tax=Alicyclobacillus fastidiosus TaxID=392011 RepID=A0ABY6ZLP6_9BACL|nr:UDP-N-acetylmuramoyl-tripeptide--D-alanyl-D-alanine ligase [Alicyclobacillus fastidiosus]WAH43828.1 UDP-N-acetylmuramoyl-tripeptide--D-alanyl-D-alanine ligase [Alicyclobacillus fastidiosus]GMA60059.1 UDP-N-acetylmuramoyl-tripeptide--D-alanyl-D-alanine ligase [Alicyclobacillus fastidiosus]